MYTKSRKLWRYFEELAGQNRSALFAVVTANLFFLYNIYDYIDGFDRKQVLRIYINSGIFNGGTNYLFHLGGRRI